MTDSQSEIRFINHRKLFEVHFHPSFNLSPVNETSVCKFDVLVFYVLSSLILDKSFFTLFWNGIFPQSEATWEGTLGRSLQKPKNNQLHDESKGRKPYFRIILEDFRFGIHLTLSLKSVGNNRGQNMTANIFEVIFSLKLTVSFSSFQHKSHCNTKSCCSDNLRIEAIN